MPNTKPETDEIALANQLLEQARALFKKNNVEADPCALTDAQWNFASTTQMFDGSVDWAAYEDQFNYKLSLQTADDAVKKKILLMVLDQSVF